MSNTATKDRVAICPDCGARQSLSPHAAIVQIKCLDCGTMMSTASGNRYEEERALEAAAPALRLADEAKREIDRTQVENVAPPAPALETLMQHEEPKRKFLDIPPFGTWLGWGVLFLVIGVMATFQFHADVLGAFRPHYVAARNVLLLGVGLWVIVDAWTESYAHGLGTLLFPPYLLLYAISRVDSYVLRALVFGSLAGLVGEALLIPGDSMIMQAGPALQELIENVDGAILSASKPPV